MNTPSQQLAHYLYKPQTVLGPGVVASYSSLWLAVFDARVVGGRDRLTGAVIDADPPAKWLAAVGYVALLDQLGKSVKRPSSPATSGVALIRSLEAFSALTADERQAIYALRCAVAHDYSLANPGGAGKHLFRLDWDQVSPLIQFPATPWDGDYSNPAIGTNALDTIVNLWAVTQLAEDVVEEVFKANAAGDLELAVSPTEAEHRYFVQIS